MKTNAGKIEQGIFQLNNEETAVRLKKAINLIPYKVVPQAKWRTEDSHKRRLDFFLEDKIGHIIIPDSDKELAQCMEKLFSSNRLDASYGRTVISFVVNSGTSFEVIWLYAHQGSWRVTYDDDRKTHTRYTLFRIEESDVQKLGLDLTKIANIQYLDPRDPTQLQAVQDIISQTFKEAGVENPDVNRLLQIAREDTSEGYPLTPHDYSILAKARTNGMTAARAQLARDILVWLQKYR